MMTRKLLVAFDPGKPDRRSSDFLVVVLEGAQPQFLGIRSKKSAASGVMVYLGKEITVKELFAKLVDTGRKIQNVEQTLQVLEGYIEKLQEFRIGNVLTIESATPDGFKLVKLANLPPSTDVSKLP